MPRLVALFIAKGFDGIAGQLDATVPEAERAAVLDAYLKVLQTMLASLYTELLADNGVDLSQGISGQDGVFFDDAINATAAVGNYGSTLYIQLKSFGQIQSSGLQIGRAPGKTLVYLGFTLLIAGVFCMFYVCASRLWCWIDEADGQARLLIGGSGMRHKHDFGKQFVRLQGVLDEQFWKFC